VMDESAELICTEELMVTMAREHVTVREARRRIAGAVHRALRSGRSRRTRTATSAPPQEFRPGSRLASAAWYTQIAVICALLVSIVPTWAVLTAGAMVTGATLFVLTVRFGPPHLDVASRDRLSRRVVAPFLRTQINDAVNTPEREQSFHVRTAPGLAELSDTEFIAKTAAVDRLRRIVAGTTSGSVGISGPLGAGKTTLLQGFCGRESARSRIRAPGIGPGLMVSAPVDYDVQDFVLHVFRQLCLRALGNPSRRRTRGNGGRTAGGCSPTPGRRRSSRSPSPPSPLS
jgi:hypothetical protein